VAGDKGRDRLAAEIEDFLPVDQEDCLALHEVLDLLAEPQRMDVARRSGSCRRCDFAFACAEGQTINFLNGGS